MIKLTWVPVKDAIFGASHNLTGLPDPEWSGRAYLSAGRAVAHAFIAGRYLRHCARTQKQAIKRLNAEIDKRSIGLFGVDVVDFAS